VSRIAGIYREPECSPGRHLSNDALLLEQIGHELRRRGADVTLMPSEEALARRPHASLIFSMCQGPGALAALQDWEREGAHIVNSPASALNTYRDHLPSLLGRAGVPFPSTRLIETIDRTADIEPLGGVYWLKRGDVHASVSADVQRIESQDALRAGLADFRSRGIHHAALQEHRPGAEIKFYGVTGGFFHWFFTSAAPTETVSVAALQRLGHQAARAAGLDVYGGDIIVDPSGALTLIDLNDWPSFAPCRDAASEAIADFLMRRVHAAWNTGLVSSANESAL
jgi:glutathione synthase/RimK-type ligase-like ATP-grasp enzyme